MPANYNKTAWFYDALSRLVFGKALIRSQTAMLQKIATDSAVLIIGGGSGKILEDLAILHPAGLRITYVEIAENMMALSRDRKVGGNSVGFITKAIEDVKLSVSYDVVITGFVLDNYTEDELPAFFNHISRQLKPRGLWLNTDFQFTGKWWQRVLMLGMYRFFKLFANIKNSALPDIKNSFKKAGYHLIEEKTFYGDFISAQAWKKI